MVLFVSCFNNCFASVNVSYLKTFLTTFLTSGALLTGYSVKQIANDIKKEKEKTCKQNTEIKTEESKNIQTNNYDYNMGISNSYTNKNNTKGKRLVRTYKKN